MAVRLTGVRWLPSLFAWSPYLLLPALIGTFAGLYWLGAFLQAPLILGFLVGNVLFIFARGVQASSISVPAVPLPETRVHSKILYVAFFALLSASAISLQTVTYTKPLVFYVLVAVQFGILTVVPRRERWSVCWYLCVVLLGALVFLSQQIVFPHGFGGSDSYYHISQIVEPVVERGRVPLGTNYSGYPGSHVFASINAIVLGTPGRNTYYVLLSVVLLVVALWVYLFSRTVLREMSWGVDASHLAGLSMLVFFAEDFVIRQANLGFQLVYTSLYILVLLALVTSITYGGSGGQTETRYKAIMLLVFAALVATHHYSLVIFFALFVPLVVLTPGRTFDWTFLLVTGVVLLAHWTFTAGWYGLPLVVSSAAPIFYELGVSSPTQASTSQPIDVIVYTTLGVSILLATLQSGLLRAFSHRGELYEKVVPLLAYVLFALMGVGVVTGISGFSPHRMLFFAQVIFVPIFFVVGCWTLYRSQPRAFAAAVIVFVAFFSLSGLSAGIETSVVGDDIAHNKLFETSHENAAATWYERHQDGDQRVYASRSFVDFETDTVMIRPHLEASTVGAELLPVAFDRIDFESVRSGERILYTTHDETLGYKPGLEKSDNFGEGEYTTLDPASAQRLEREHRIYSAGTARIYVAT